MQQPGREFGGNKQFYGTIVECGERDEQKYVIVDFHTAYNIPELTLARRTLSLDFATGEAVIHDLFGFEGNPQPVEEAFVTWDGVVVSGDTVTISGKQSTITARADGAHFAVEYLEKESKENERQGILKRISTTINGIEFTLRITPIKG